MPNAPRKHRPGGARTRRYRVAEEDRQSTRDLHTGVKQWLQIRQFVMVRDGYRCKCCGRVAVGKNAHIDHVDGDSTNNPPDGSNWQLLHRSCHSSKTARETGFRKRGRVRGRGGAEV